MDFIILSIKLLLTFAWLVLLYFAAFALAMYIIGAVIELASEAINHGAAYLVRNPMLTLRNAHHQGVNMALGRKWALA